MSYGGYEYNERGGGGYGGFDPMGGGYGGMDLGGGGGFNTEEKGAKGSDKKSKDKNSLIPVSIKQLLTASRVDDTFKVDGSELFTVKVIGLIDSLQEHSTNVNFRVTDGTGYIECKQWIEKNTVASSKLTNTREGSLVRIVGNLREYENKIHILVYDFSVVSDWNELSYHLLDTILTHCQQTKGPLPGSNNSGARSGMPGMIGSPMAVDNRGFQPTGGNYKQQQQPIMNSNDNSSVERVNNNNNNNNNTNNNNNNNNNNNKGASSVCVKQ